MSDFSIRFFDLKEERFASIKAKNIMTPIVSNKVHLFTGWRDIPKDKPQALHFLKKSLMVS